MTPNTQPTHHLLHFFIFSVCVIGIAAIGLTIYSTVRPPHDDERTAQTESETLYNFGLTEEVEPVPISGKIFLSLQSKEEGVLAPQMYSIDVGQTSSTPEAFVRDWPNIGTQFVFDDNENEFYTITGSERSIGSDDPLQVHYINLDTKKEVPIQHAPAALERFLSLSPFKGKLAYSVQNEYPQNYQDLTSINNFELFILDIKTGSSTSLGVGVHPMWAPKVPQLLYAKSDGLYRYSFETNASEKVIGLAEDGISTITTESMFELSPDGRYLVWTTSAHNHLAVFEVTSWEPFEYVNLGGIQTPNTSYFWPTFSPDSAYYAVQAIDSIPNSEERINPRIEIRNIKSRQVLQTHSLEGFEFMRAFTDDWIY